MSAERRAHGICPRCGRVVSGRALGIGRMAGKYVALSPHKTRDRPPSEWCLKRHHYRPVPRIQDDAGSAG